MKKEVAALGAVLFIVIASFWASQSEADFSLPNAKGEWCYQEFANASISCGGLSTGSYAPVHYSPWSQNDFWKDGAWNNDFATWLLHFYPAQEPPESHLGEFLVDYTIPPRALYSSAIRIKDIFKIFDSSGSRIDAAYTVPFECFAGGTLRFKFSARNRGVTAWCQTATGWDAVRSISFTDPEAADLESVYGIIEEAMLWDMAMSPEQCDTLKSDRKALCKADF